MSARPQWNSQFGERTRVVACPRRSARGAHHPLLLDAAAWIGFALLNVKIHGPGPSDFLFPLILAAALLTGCRTLTSTHHPREFLLLMSAFLVCFSLSAAIGGYDAVYLGYTASNLVLCIFIKLYVRSARETAVLLKALTTGAVVCGILAVAAFFGWWSPNPQLFMDVVRDSRFFALRGDPNMLGILTAMLMIWLIDELLYPKLWKKGSYVKIAAIGLGALQLAATFSRAGIVFLLAGLAFYIALLLQRPGSGRLGRLGVLVALLLGIAVVVSHESQGLKVGAAAMAARFSVNSDESARFDHTRAGLTLAAEHPLGVGPGWTKFILGGGTGTFNSHNTLVEILADNGWIASVIFLLAYGYLVCRAVQKSVRRERVLSGISYELMAGLLVGLAACSFFHDLTYVNICWIPPSLGWAVLWTPGENTVGRMMRVTRRLDDPERAILAVHT